MGLIGLAQDEKAALKQKIEIRLGGFQYWIYLKSRRPGLLPVFFSLHMNCQ
jgi:hypothetical protein